MSDNKVINTVGQTKKTISKPVETTNGATNMCECGETTTNKCPSYFCKGCCMPPHNCLCSHED